jgi:hypothetical protein
LWAACVGDGDESRDAGIFAVLDLGVTVVPAVGLRFERLDAEERHLGRSCGPYFKQTQMYL